jgi:type II secretion system protein H
MGKNIKNNQYKIINNPFGSGFTITEVLLVVVIIALIAGVGGGLYVGTHKRMLVEKAAREFLLTAQYARIMAIEQQSRYTLQLDAANNRFWLATAQWDAQAGQTTQVIVQDYYCRPIELAGDVKFEDVQIAPMSLETAETDEGDAMVFLPNGSASSAVIRIGDGKTHYAISIDAATGKATMYFGTAEEIKMNSVDLDAER